MRKLLVMDKNDYDLNMKEIYRVAVRGIIFINTRRTLVTLVMRGSMFIKSLDNT